MTTTSKGQPIETPPYMYPAIAWGDAINELMEQHGIEDWELGKVADRKLVHKLRQEIEILRCYGNKDCTSMADAELKRLRE